MRRARSWILLLSLACTAGCLHVPLMWSPDGRWLAYAVAGRPPGQALPPGWLFRDDTPLGGEPGPAGLAYRIWATRAETGESVLLEESRFPLTSPGWSPDGTALAYGRLAGEGDAPGRFEVVVQDAPDRRRVLRSEAVRGLSPDAAGLPALAVAWSPDGRYLAVPNVQPPGLAILRADNGRVLKLVEDAYFPSWAPGGDALAFYRTGEPEGLYCLDAGLGALRHLADASGAGQPPAWDRDGRAVLVVLRRGLGRPTDQADLVRVPIDGGPAEPVATLTRQPIGPDAAFTGAWFSLDRDGQELFFTAAVEGQDSAITWYRPLQKVTQTSLAPIDRMLPSGALALSPSGKSLAVRVGPPGLLSPPALCDPRTMKATPLVPDDAARVEWLATLAVAARTLLRASYPAPVIDGTPMERPTLLPAPGETAADGEAPDRLRRLGELGRSLCDRPDGSPPADADLAARLDEARLFFAYLADDYAGAAEALQAVESRATDPDGRLRLLALRAQIALGRKDLPAARDAIALLGETLPRPPLRVETTPAGAHLTPQPAPGSRWPDFLAARAEALERARPGPDGADEAGAVVELVHPDAPEPPPGLPGAMAPLPPNPLELRPAIPFDRLPRPAAPPAPDRRFLDR